MPTTNVMLATPLKRRLTPVIAMAVFALLMTGCARATSARESGTKTFSSPAEACHALFQAAQENDEQALQVILGAGKELTSPGQESENKLEREGFVQKYQEMHRLVREPDGITVLYIGAENWAFPIPLVSKDGKWHFDSDAGRQEVLFRRIGENELVAIEACHALIQTTNKSEIKAASGDPTRQSVENLTKASAPFYGYYFRTLAGQQTGRAAFVAYPSKYRSTGIMTFIVTPKGVVYEKNLGPKTAELAKAMTEFKPDRTWHVADE